MIKNEIVTGSYRCKDPIKNFKVKIKIQEKQSAINFPKRERGRTDTPEPRAIEERVFSWQEKVINGREISKTSVANDALQPSCILFTVTDNAVESNIACRNDKYINLPEVKHRQFPRTFARKNIVTLNTKLRDHTKHSPVGLQTFRILADLRIPDDSQNLCEEYELCTIVWNKTSNILSVTPDFSRNPYYLEVNHHGKYVYQYWVEHASNDITILKRDIIQKLNKQLIDIRKPQVSFDFHKPSPGFLDVYITGEIKSARHFDSDSLFIHYFLELPNGWKCDNISELSGTTHTCSSNKTKIMIGHIFEFKLSFDLDAFQIESDITHSSPQLFLEILSYDCWGRSRSEGYGFIHLPFHPGHHSVVICTWRPSHTDFVSQMRRYFLGGAPELVHPTYSGVPHYHQSKILGRHGMQTVTSGEVEIILNIVHQCEVLRDDFKFTAEETVPREDLLGRLSAATLVHSVNAVLIAFRQAKERMIQARKQAVTS